MNAHYKLSKPALLATLMLSLCVLSVCPVGAQTDQTLSRLQVVNSAVEEAFNAVLDAEKAGANVTALLDNLNNAQNILAQAENSNRNGDFNTAAARADSVLSIAQQVTIAAQNAKQTALTSGQNAFWSTTTLTVIGAFVFVLVLFLVWRKFKRNHIKNLSEAKPEVVSQ